MKTLTLPLKKKWFDMIKTGVKKEEYRAANEYWATRLVGKGNFAKEDYCGPKEFDLCFFGFESLTWTNDLKFIHFDKLVFTLGYPKAGDIERRLVFKNPKIRIGKGRHEWGAEYGKMYFVITWEAE